MRETEAALLGLKRQRLLQEVDALHGGSNQQQQGEQGGQPPDTAALAASAATEPAAHLRPGAICVFRQTDGRHYFGRVLESQGDSVSLQPLLPTRQAGHALCRVGGMAIQQTGNDSYAVAVQALVTHTGCCQTPRLSPTPTSLQGPPARTHHPAGHRPAPRPGLT